MPDVLAGTALEKRFGDHEVLCGCDLSVAAGQCAVVRGRSGGGKSTLLRTLALLIAPDAGVVTHASARYDFSNGSPPVTPPSPFPFLTLVFQQLFLWPHLRIDENIAFTLTQNRRATLTQRAIDVVEFLGVGGVLKKYPAECSLGQRQRIAVARAVLTDTRFLMLDEPTSALDRSNRSLMVNLLGEVKTSGRGILVVSHDERDFESIGDLGFELEGGVLTPL